MISQDGNKRKAPKRMPLYILLGLTIVIAVFLIALYPMVMVKTDKTVMFRIPANATTQVVSDSLAKHYGPSLGKTVIRLLKMRNVDFSRRHGQYEIPEGCNAIAVARRLGGGGQTPVRITVNGFRDIDLLVRRISAKLDFSPDSLKAILTDPSEMSKYGLTPQQALALFIDDTYEVYWTATPCDVIKKIGDNYLDVWNPSRTEKAALLSLTPAQIMTVASIADEESNAAAEKGTIGRLYINRLHKGMRLQADPTIRFALNDFTIRRVKGDQLKVNSPYNTYLNPGLPPGPIRTTSRATIDAILDSKPSSYLYMCAKEDFSGTHNFASTYSEHTANALRYQRELDKRGIR